MEEQKSEKYDWGREWAKKEKNDYWKRNPLDWGNKWWAYEIDYLVEKDEKTGCWNWIGKFDSKGYGIVQEGPKSYQSARQANWEAQKRTPLEEDGVLVDTCGNRKCVFDGHMLPTDRAHMMKTMAATHDFVTVAKINWEMADRIREMYASGMKRMEISKLVNVGYTQVTKIIAGTAWVRPENQPVIVSLTAEAMRLKAVDQAKIEAKEEEQRRRENETVTVKAIPTPEVAAAMAKLAAMKAAKELS